MGVSTDRLLGMTENELNISVTAAIAVAELVGRMIADADKRNAAIATPRMADLYAHTDAMRDLRDALVDAGLLAL